MDLGHFLAWRAGTSSQYSTGESPPIKAGHQETIPHLETTCEIHHIYEEQNVLISGTREKSAVGDSEIPPSLNSKQAACFFSSAGFSMARGISPGAEISTLARILPSAFFSLAAGISSFARI
jgi:hypothetical protein